MIYDKCIMLAGDFNISVLNFGHNKKAQDFLNLLIQVDMIQTTNKATTIIKNTTTAIDHITTN